MHHLMRWAIQGISNVEVACRKAHQPPLCDMEATYGSGTFQSIDSASVPRLVPLVVPPKCVRN